MQRRTKQWMAAGGMLAVLLLIPAAETSARYVQGSSDQSSARLAVFTLKPGDAYRFPAVWFAGMGPGIQRETVFELEVPHETAVCLELSLESTQNLPLTYQMLWNHQPVQSEWVEEGTLGTLMLAPEDSSSLSLVLQAKWDESQRDPSCLDEIDAVVLKASVVQID